MVHQIWLIETFLCHNNTTKDWMKDKDRSLWRFMSDQKMPTVSICNCSHKFVQFYDPFCSIKEHLYWFVFFLYHEIRNTIWEISQVMSLWHYPLRADPTNCSGLWLSLLLIRHWAREGRGGVYRCLPHGVWVRTETGEWSGVWWDRQQMGQSRLRRHHHWRLGLYHHHLLG